MNTDEQRLTERRTPFSRKQVRHGMTEPRKPAFTEAELAEINRRFDEQNGFHLDMPTVFQNPARRPETEFRP